MAQRKRTPQKPKETAGSELRCRATLAQLADAFGVGRRTLARYQAEGAFGPVVAAQGRRAALFDAFAVARVLINWPENARDARDRAQAELLQLRLQRERGEVLDAKDEARRDYEAARTIRDSMLNVPGRMAELTDAQRAHLEDEIHGTLVAVADLLAGGAGPEGELPATPPFKWELLTPELVLALVAEASPPWPWVRAAAPRLRLLAQAGEGIRVREDGAGWLPATEWARTCPPEYEEKPRP